MKNRFNKEGEFLGPPKEALMTKSATGFTQVVAGPMSAGVRPFVHADSPLTMATDKENFGVGMGGPEPSYHRTDARQSKLPARRDRWSIRSAK